MRKHKPDMLAEWAKENKVKGWEHFWIAYHPTEVAKRRQRSLRDYNRKNSQSRKYS